MENKAVVHEEILIDRGLKDMDVLDLRLSVFRYGPERTSSVTCAIYVNGKEFREIVEESPDIGSYGGFVNIRAGELYDAIKEPTDDLGEAIYGCGCGIIDCNPLYTRIRINGSHVIWDRFDPDIVSEEGSPIWSLGAYVFDKDQYYKEVEKLRRWDKESDLYYNFCYMLQSSKQEEIEEYLASSVSTNAVYNSKNIYDCGKNFSNDFYMDQGNVVNAHLHVMPVSCVIKGGYEFLLDKLDNLVILSSSKDYKTIYGIYFLDFNRDKLAKVNYVTDFSIFDFDNIKEPVLY